MNEILQELEKYRKEDYEFIITVLKEVDVVVFKRDVLLTEIVQEETIEDALKEALKYIYRVKRIPKNKRIKL